MFPAPLNPDRCTDAAMLLCATLAELFNTGIHTQPRETRRQAEIADARYGTTAVANLQDLSVLSAR